MEVGIPAFAGMTGGGCGNYGAGRGEMAPRLRGGFGWGAGVTGVVGVMGVGWVMEVGIPAFAGMTGGGVRELRGGAGMDSGFRRNDGGGMRRLALRGLVAVWRRLEE